MALYQDDVSDERAEQILQDALSRIVDWAKNPKGKGVIVNVLVGDAYCKLSLNIEGSWSEMRRERLADLLGFELAEETE